MFWLSGEHPTLPAGEVRGAVEAERKGYRILEKHDCVLVVETNADPHVLASRLAMTRKICTHLWTSPATERDILDSLGSTDLVDRLPHKKSFAVRVCRVKRSSPDLSTSLLVKKIAMALKDEVDFRVDLENPDFEIFCVLTGGACVGGITRATVDPRQFTLRKPQRRSAFHPSTLPPKLARCMVNLARTPRGGTLLDPFCGIGGILLEAGLIGAKVVGIDISQKMIDGAEKNLKSFGLTDFELKQGDARKLGKIEVDAIATDPPYGRQSSTGGAKLRELYRDVLPPLIGALEPHRYICISSPDWIEMEDFADGVGLEEIERHVQRVHRSLTRHIYVFQRR